MRLILLLCLLASTASAERYRAADFRRVSFQKGAFTFTSVVGVRGGLVCGVPQAKASGRSRAVLLDDGETIVLVGIEPPGVDEEGRPLRRCYVLVSQGRVGDGAEATGEYAVRREGPTP